MGRNYRVGALAFFLAALSQDAQAFLDSPYVTPEHPAAGETIYINIYGGVCDSIISVPGYPQITQQGDAIRILLLSAHYDSSELCFFPVGTATIPVGAYANGAYTLQVDRIYSDAGGNPIVETMGILPFVVSGAAVPAVAAPTLGSIGTWILGLVLARLAGRRLSRCRRYD